MELIDDYTEVLHTNAMNFFQKFFINSEYKYENIKRFFKLPFKLEKITRITAIPPYRLEKIKEYETKDALQVWDFLRSYVEKITILNLLEKLGLDLIESYQQLRVIDFSSKEIEEANDAYLWKDKADITDDDRHLQFYDVRDYLNDIGDTFEVLNLNNNEIYDDCIEDLIKLIESHNGCTELWIMDNPITQMALVKLISLIDQNKLKVVKHDGYDVLDTALRERIVKYEKPYTIKDGHLYRKIDNYYAVLKSSQALDSILESLSGKNEIYWIPPNSYYRIINDTIEIFDPHKWHQTPDVV